LQVIFIMNGGNILALQRILVGHHSLNMTRRYGHLSPDHLDEVKRHNPSAFLAMAFEPQPAKCQSEPTA
jgi:hypothetical protein